MASKRMVRKNKKIEPGAATNQLMKIVEFFRIA